MERSSCSWSFLQAWYSRFLVLGFCEELRIPVSVCKDKILELIGGEWYWVWYRRPGSEGCKWDVPLRTLASGRWDFCWEKVIGIMMGGGRDEERKKMEENPMMFPRIHVNDRVKGGPRAPPRNKMALYEQFSIPLPSQRSTFGMDSSSSTVSSKFLSNFRVKPSFELHCWCTLRLNVNPKHLGESFTFMLLSQ